METYSFSLTRDILHDHKRALSLEWVLPNGLGGYASQSVLGVSTRRYHALLMAAKTPPVGRYALLSSLEDFLETTPLATHAYTENKLYPDGYSILSRFDLQPAPTWIFTLPTHVIARRVEVITGYNATRISYFLLKGPPCKLKFSPLFAFRDDHGLRTKENWQESSFSFSKQTLLLFPKPEELSCSLFVGNADFHASPDWFYRFMYEKEKERGFSYQEDLFTPGTFTIELSTRKPYAFWAFAQKKDPPQISLSVPPALEIKKENSQQHRFFGPLLLAKEGLRRKKLQALYDNLSQMASRFFVKRPLSENDGLSIVAGYPWFTDWGRDTMISLPGLCLATNQTQTAKHILKTWASFFQKGLLPNRFSDREDQAEYHAADAALWFVWAAERYASHTKDFAFILETLMPTFQEIVERYGCALASEKANLAPRSDGTITGKIGIGSDGLLYAIISETPPQKALTWMDACVDGKAVTPRSGAPIELQGLWANALATILLYAKRASDISLQKRCTTLLDQLMGSLGYFVRHDGKGLLDVVSPDDPSIRPNQLLALSLPYPLFRGMEAKRILRVVTKHLLTSRGLRSLSPESPLYQARYEGDPNTRNKAYHQGTVWPWLLGAYGSAYLAAYGKESVKARVHIEDSLLNLVPHLHESGLGMISEIFDGEAPHKARGCIAQAWSVAEPLRLLHEELGLHL